MAEWISVGERLPEQEGWYLVYTIPDKKHKSINKAEFCKGYEWNNFEPCWRGAGGHWGNVAYWMPLPEPPRTPKERGGDKPKVTCLNCKHLMFSDMYGECNKQLKIVNPSDNCEYAEPKEMVGEK